MHLGEDKTEQFTVRTMVDGKEIGCRPVHDPFIHTTVTIGISRWGLFKALFRKHFTLKIQVCLEGTPGAQRAIMMLDPSALQKTTEEMQYSRSHPETWVNNTPCQN